MNIFHDLLIILFLAFLEGILSIDNALVLAILAHRLPQNQQKKALLYGIVGAFVFRFIAIGSAAFLMQWNWVKFVGGGYLLFIAIKGFWETSRKDEKHPEHHHGKIPGFWTTVLVIELTDIAFAVDSILAAIALSPKFYIVFLGGILGVVLMRFAANGFISLLDRFPKLEHTAYLLVLLIGIKVILEGLHLPGLDFHSPGHPSFIIFWLLMASCIVYGFWDKNLEFQNNQGEK